MARTFRISGVALVCITGLLTFCSADAGADPITRTFQFTATDFLPGSVPSPPPPQDVIAGLLTLTFDPTNPFPPAAAPDQIFLAISGHSYTRDEVRFEYGGPVNVDQTFWVGVPGLNILNGGTNDFLLSFIYDPIADVAKFGYGFSYTTPTAATDYSSPFTTVAVVPEPGTGALLLLGGSLGWALRRRLS